MYVLLSLYNIHRVTFCIKHIKSALRALSSLVHFCGYLQKTYARPFLISQTPTPTVKMREMERYTLYTATQDTGCRMAACHSVYTVMEPGGPYKGTP